MTTTMIILGIDPGTTSIGYALLDCSIKPPKILEARLVPLSSSLTEDRLMDIHREIKKIITKWKPDATTV